MTQKEVRYFFSSCHSTVELKLANFYGLPWKLESTETLRASHINKTDDITCWKDKHSFFRGYQKNKLPLAHVGTISAKLARNQNITGNTQKQISAYSECSAARREQPGAQLEALKNEFKVQQKRKRSVCLFLPSSILTIFLPRQTENANESNCYDI